MKRAFASGFFTIASTNTPQPLVGTTITTAVAPSNNPVNVAVASSAMFNVGDCVLLYDGSGSSVVQEAVYVIAIPDSTHVRVNATGQQNSGVANSYSTSGFVILNINVNNVYVEAKIGNAALLTLGANRLLNATTGAYAIAQLVNSLGGPPTNFNAAETVGQNPGAIGQFWIVGTAADSYLVTLGLD